MKAHAERNADLAVLGGGAAGLSIAAGAARLGLDVVLFEPGEMGGDCLNRGCVPSKALLAAAARVKTRRDAGADISLGAAFAEAMSHVRRAIDAIAPHDSQERFEGLGVEVVRAPARFIDDRTLVAEGRHLRARRFALATGSRPAIPAIEGLADARYLTSETLWSLADAPARLAILGGGPMGVELAQAFARLGSTVTVIEAEARLLPSAPAAHAALIGDALAAEGVTLLTGARVLRVEPAGEGARLKLEGLDIEADALLLAAGRRARVDGLGLEEAGVAVDGGRIRLDRRLRTSNRRVFALGDVAGGPALTHAAGYHASVVLRNIAFRLPSKATAPIAAAVYTDPEIAWIGADPATAAEHGARLARWTFAQNDRAQAEGGAAGEAIIVAGKGGRILGGSIVGPGAGELISLVALAMQSNLKLSALASLIAPYPTRAEIIKRAAGAWYEPLVFGEAARRAVGLLARLP